MIYNDEFDNPASIPNPCLPPGVISHTQLEVLSSALNKLEALGLTADEALAVVGVSASI